MAGIKGMRGRVQPFAVEKHGVEDYVLDLYKKNVSAAKISAMLKAEKKIEITSVGINRWLKEQRQADTQTTELQSKEKFDLVAMDYKNEIQTILDEVKLVRTQALQERKLDTYVKLVGKLYEGLELIAKLTGDIKQNDAPKIDINVIIKELNYRAFSDNKSMRDAIHGNDGLIIDVEAEIEQEDKKMENKIRKAEVIK